jgi:beta-glucosidase-like glycosyl hydrolase
MASADSNGYASYLTNNKTSDGPNGARGGVFTGGTRAACFPAAVCAAATWDPANGKRIGHALAEETKTKSARVLYVYSSVAYE